MKTIMKRDGIKTITTHYIDGMFVGSHGGGGQFAGPIVQCGVNAFLATEKALQELPLTRSWGKTTVTLEPVGVANLITAGNAKRAVHLPQAGLAPVFADLNQYDATSHFVGQSTIFTLTEDRATGVRVVCCDQNGPPVKRAEPDWR